MYAQDESSKTTSRRDATNHRYSGAKKLLGDAVISCGAKKIGGWPAGSRETVDDASASEPARDVSNSSSTLTPILERGLPRKA